MIAKLIIATLLTGIISGFFITFYEILITFTTRLLFMGDPFETIPVLPAWYLYLVPTLAIFFVNYLISKDNYIREYGLTEIAESVGQNKMIISVKTLILKVIASTLSISSGYAVGTEGPSAGMGAMVAYRIHRLFKLPSMLVKMMISVGASSGIAAIFVSPLTGIVFSIENIAYQKFRTMRNIIFSLIGGSVIGTVLLIEPHAAFSGKEIVMHLINNTESISVYFIFLIIILRIVGTTVSLYANAVGGLFLPLMSIGALVGYGYGEILTFYSHFPFEPFFFAAVGAAVFMGVVMKLPLTAVVLALELTFDYNILVATGVSVVLVGYLTSFHFDIRKKYVTQAEETTDTVK